MGGWKKRGAENLTNDTPPKKGFWTPLVRYVFHHPQVSVLCFSCTKIHDKADQKLFSRGPKIFGRARSLVRFPPPIRFAPPHITTQRYFSEDRRDHFSWILEYFWRSSRNLRGRLLSSEKFSEVFIFWGFYPPARFQSVAVMVFSALTFVLSKDSTPWDSHLGNPAEDEWMLVVGVFEQHGPGLIRRGMHSEFFRRGRALGGQTAVRRIIYAPPPSPHFWPKGIFQGRGGGGVYFEAPRGRNFIRPPRVRVKWVPFVKLAFLQQNGAFFWSKKGDFRRFRTTF